MSEKGTEDGASRELRRFQELSKITVDQVAARGDNVWVKCLDWGKARTFAADNPFAWPMGIHRQTPIRIQRTRPV